MLQPTRVFTLAFFAIALVACIVLTMFITLTLVRRRRARLQYLSRSRMSTVSHPVSFRLLPYYDLSRSICNCVLLPAFRDIGIIAKEKRVTGVRTM